VNQVWGALLEAIENKYETEAAVILEKAKNAILEGGYDDLATATAELAALIREQSPLLKDSPQSQLIRSLIANADILASDSKYLPAAIRAYGDAARLSAGRDNDLNKQSISGILEKAEFLPDPADRISAYQLAVQGASAHSALASLAKHKSREQKDEVYFKLRSPRALPRLEEAIVEGDLRAVLKEGIHSVIRQQAPSGDIQYSVVVPRGFSRGKLAQAGVQNAQKLRRISADDDLDRIVVPANMLPHQTQRDIDFLTRLRNAGIVVNAIHGRIRDGAGVAIGYKIPEGANPDRLSYMGIKTQGIIPQDGKIIVLAENIDFNADPALIGKWNWIPASGGNIRSRVPPNERPRIIQSLQAHGVTPCDDMVGSENLGYIEVTQDEKGRLNKIIRQHLLQERSRQLLSFAESLPDFANVIALAAYKDACGFIFGLQHRR